MMRIVSLVKFFIESKLGVSFNEPCHFRDAFTEKVNISKSWEPSTLVAYQEVTNWCRLVYMQY